MTPSLPALRRLTTARLRRRDSSAYTVAAVRTGRSTLGRTLVGPPVRWQPAPWADRPTQEDRHPDRLHRRRCRIARRARLAPCPPYRGGRAVRGHRAAEQRAGGVALQPHRRSRPRRLHAGHRRPDRRAGAVGPAVRGGGDDHRGRRPAGRRRAGRRPRGRRRAHRPGGRGRPGPARLGGRAAGGRARHAERRLRRPGGRAGAGGSSRSTHRSCCATTSTRAGGAVFPRLVVRRRSRPAR